MKRLTIDKGLLRQTEIVQNEIEALVRCDVSRVYSGITTLLTIIAAPWEP